MNNKDMFIMHHRNPYSQEDKVFLDAVDRLLLVYKPHNYLDIDMFINIFSMIAAENTNLFQTCDELKKMFVVLKHATKSSGKDKRIGFAHKVYGKRVMDLLCLLSGDKEYKMFNALWPWFPDDMANRLMQKVAYNPNATLCDMSSALGAGLAIDSNTMGLIKIIAIRDYKKANSNADEIKYALSRVMEYVDKSDWYHAESNGALLHKMLGVNVVSKPKEDHWTLRKARADRAAEYILSMIRKQQGYQK